MIDESLKEADDAWDDMRDLRDDCEEKYNKFQFALEK